MAYARAWREKYLADRTKRPSGDVPFEWNCSIQIEFGMRNSSAEQITLGKLDPCGLQCLELLAALNALGHRHDVEAARQCQHRVNDRRAIPAACKPLRERLVDLDLVERKARQVARRGVSRPAIVAGT